MRRVANCYTPFTLLTLHAHAHHGLRRRNDRSLLVVGESVHVRRVQFWTITHTHTHTHTQRFNGPFSGTIRVGRHQKGKTDLEFTEATDSEWQWHQLGRMQVCTSLQTDNHASTPPLSFFTGRMPFLPPNQQRQSTEGTYSPQDRSRIRIL